MDIISFMNCDAYRILISGYIDEELSNSESQRLKAHLKGCDSCLQYLQQQEKIRAAVKRYTFVKEVPEVPVNFASRITQQLEDQLQRVPQPSLTERMKTRFRATILEFVDGWIGSLKARPFAWTASVSCFFVLFAALVMNEIYQQTPQHLAQKTTPVSETALLEDISAESLIQFEETDVSEQNSRLAEDVDGSDFIVIAELNEDSTLPSAQKKSDPLQDYVYSHVVEAYQDRLIDDAMLVGYVQDAAFIQ